MSVPLVVLFVLLSLAIGVAIGRTLSHSRDRERLAGARDHAGEGGDGAKGGKGGDAAALVALRAQALDASLEAVILVSPEGHIRDCNAAALATFGRHRSEMEALDAIAVRRLFDDGRREVSWGGLVASRSPWMGESVLRLPDGSTRECISRVLPLFGSGGAVEALVEVHRSLGDGGAPFGGRASGFAHAALMDDRPDQQGGGERGDLRFLAAAFHDLERVVRQYERLLPAMRGEDPLSEVIAGVAAETTEVTQSVDVPTLLREVPLVLARLDATLASRPASPADSRPPATS